MKTNNLFKFIFLLFFLSLTNICLYAQTVNLSRQNVRIADVFDELEKQTRMSIGYNESTIDVNRRISVNIADQPVDKAMGEILKNTNTTYHIQGKQILIVPSPSAIKQDKKQVVGVVLDESGEPVTGANIVEKETTNGITTDIDGKFLLQVEEDAVLQISYIGYIPQEIQVKNRKEFVIMLKEDLQKLEEIVVVGYGSQKRASVTGAVATVHADKLSKAPVASTTNALSGRLPGLITKQSSGLPGSDNASLSIRGFGNPLIIVDGVETGFNNIDANEIESVTILKDASSAIYGARAGDGVILVTTKRGTLAKPTISFNAMLTFQSATNLVKMGSSGQMAELIRETHFNSGKTEETAQFTKEEVDLFYAGTNPDYPNTDWLDVVARDWAPQQQYNLSVRGGSEKIKYYGFLSFLDQRSMFKHNGGEYQRYNFRSNIDAKILDNLSVQFDVSSIVEKKDFPWRSDEKENSVWQEYWQTNPWYSSSLPDPTKLAYGGAGGAVGIHAMTNSDIIGYKKTDNQNIKGTLSLNYDFIYVKGLSAKAFVNYNQGYNFYKVFDRLPESWIYNYSNDTYTMQTSATVPKLSHNDSKSRVLTGQFSLNYNRVFAEDHDVSALFLYEAIDTYSDWISASRQGYKTFLIDYLFAGALPNQTSDGSATEMARLSYIGRLNYAYKSKYLIEGTVRIDKSAKFSKKNRRGTFPSVSVGWRISEEGFIKDNLELLQNLKLRLSYSQTGKDEVGNFQYLSGYEYGLTYLMGSDASQGLVEKGIANPLLTWEKMTIYNVGLDFGLSKRLLYGEVDFFYRKRDGIPGTQTVSLPSTFGATLPVVNLNDLNTRGFELTLGNEGKVNDFQWDASVNLSWSRSKWSFFDEPEYDDPDQERLNKKTGQWYDRTFGYVSEGLFTSQDEIDALTYVYDETQGNAALKPGDVRYKDMNGDGILNWRDQVEIGKGEIPHWMTGINLDLAYKNFDLSALFQGAFGFDQKVVLKWGTNYSELMYNERWTPDNNHKDGLIPRLGGAASNSWGSDFYYKSGDYIRLKTLSIGYSLPRSLLHKMNMQNFRIYAAGTNLFTISGLNKYSIDPEAPSGYSGYYYPQMRTVTIGLNLSF